MLDLMLASLSFDWEMDDVDSRRREFFFFASLTVEKVAFLIAQPPVGVE